MKDYDAIRAANRRYEKKRRADPARYGRRKEAVKARYWLKHSATSHPLHLRSGFLRRRCLLCQALLAVQHQAAA